MLYSYYMTDFARIAPTFEQFGVVYAGLFGSRARGEMHDRSDYDLLVEFSSDRQYTLLDLAALQRSLEQSLNAPVDLVTKKSLHPYLKDHILADLHTIYDQRT